MPRGRKIQCAELREAMGTNKTGQLTGCSKEFEPFAQSRSKSEGFYALTMTRSTSLMLRGFDRVDSLKTFGKLITNSISQFSQSHQKIGPKGLPGFVPTRPLKHLAHMPGNPVFIGIIGGPLWNSNPFAVIRNDPLVKSTGAVGGFGDDDRHRV